jgi:hypothetical protein
MKINPKNPHPAQENDDMKCDMQEAKHFRTYISLFTG